LLNRLTNQIPGELADFVTVLSELRNNNTMPCPSI
jgi:hypothetical protein